jgi:hypothetical protein
MKELGAWARNVRGRHDVGGAFRTVADLLVEMCRMTRKDMLLNSKS